MVALPLSKPATRSRFTLSLRTLLLFVTVLSIWFALESNKARRQCRAIAEIDKRQGHVMLSDEWNCSAGADLPARHNSSSPRFVHWLRDLLGPGYFVNISGVAVTDAAGGLAFLDETPRLKCLSIEKSAVTDDDLAPIKDQTHLIYLWLDDNRNVSDAALTRLKNMKRLKYLYIRNTAVTDAGIAALKKELPNVRICYGVEPEQKFQ